MIEHCINEDKLQQEGIKEMNKIGNYMKNKRIIKGLVPKTV